MAEELILGAGQVIVGRDPADVRMRCTARRWWGLAGCKWEGPAAMAYKRPGPAGTPRLCRCPRCGAPLRAVRGRG